MGGKFGANKERKNYGGISSWKTKCFTLKYQLPEMTCYQMIVNWLLAIVSDNVYPP